MVSVHQIHYHLGRKHILQDVSACFESGKINMILGPNGSGKSTLLKIISGDLELFDGDVFINGNPLRSQSKTKLSTYRAVMSQEPHLQFPLSVKEVIMMGRYPFFHSNPGKTDQQVCAAVIELLKLGDVKNRNYLTLSGGEKQRVQFARVLAQIWQPQVECSRYLFLDEPLNSLDIYYQHEFLQVATSLLNEKTVIVAILHDLNLALRYGQNFLFLNEGRAVVSGGTDIVTPELLSHIYGIQARIIHHPDYSSPYLLIS